MSCEPSRHEDCKHCITHRGHWVNTTATVPEPFRIYDFNEYDSVLLEILR